MKRKKKKEGYLFVYMTDAELTVYGPDKFDTLQWAFVQLHKDCAKIARHEGRDPEDILQSCIRSLEDRIRLLWVEVPDDRKRES